MMKQRCHDVGPKNMMIQNKNPLKKSLRQPAACCRRICVYCKRTCRFGIQLWSCCHSALGHACLICQLPHLPIAWSANCLICQLGFQGNKLFANRLALTLVVNCRQRLSWAIPFSLSTLLSVSKSPYGFFSFVFFEKSQVEPGVQQPASRECNTLFWFLGVASPGKKTKI